jgi:hypothetical protein
MDRKIALVVLSTGIEITIVTNDGETIEQCLLRKKIDWQAYLPI